MARSGLSLAQAAGKAPAGGEDADVSSMQLRPRLRGGCSAGAAFLGRLSWARTGTRVLQSIMLLTHGKDESGVTCSGARAGALELPLIEGSTAGEKAENALRMANVAMADARQKVGQRVPEVPQHVQ